MSKPTPDSFFHTCITEEASEAAEIVLPICKPGVSQQMMCWALVDAVLHLNQSYSN